MKVIRSDWDFRSNLAMVASPKMLIRKVQTGKALIRRLVKIAGRPMVTLPEPMIRSRMLWGIMLMICMTTLTSLAIG